MSVTLSKSALSRGRAVCPKCGRKGVGYAGHPHAFGWKDYTRATCRYCKASFRETVAKEVRDAGE